MWIFGKKKVAPYTLKDKVYESQGSLKTTLYTGTRNSDNAEFSIFEIKEENSSFSQALKANLVKSWKSYRHPSIVQYIDTYEDNGITYIVTEKVEPFKPEEFSSAEKQWCIRCITELIIFMYTNNAVHGNFLISSFYQTSGHEIRVAGLEWTSYNRSGPIYDFTSNWEQISGIKIPPESSPKYSIDCKMLSNIVKEWSNEIARPIVKIAKAWQKTNSSIPEPNQLLELDLWESDKFSQMLTFLRELPLKDNLEKDMFFKNLVENESVFSEQMLVNTILPVLAKALSFSPSPSIIPPIFAISKRMDEAEFAAKFVPQIVQLFSNKDVLLRIELLGQIGSIIPFVEKNLANDVIYQNIVGGLSSSHTQLRQATIIAMVPLAGILNSNNMMGLLRLLKNMQSDQDAQIRTNSVICVAKIAEHIDPKFREQTLAQCFGKAAMDTFTPARKAAIAAYKTNIQYFTSVTVATSVIPSISPLCIDAVEDIRIPALRLMLQLVNSLASNDMDKINEEQAPVQEKKQKEKPKPKVVQPTVETGGWDDNDDEYEAPKPKPKPQVRKVKPSVRPVMKHDDFSNDDDEEEENKEVVTAKTKPVVKTAPKAVHEVKKSKPVIIETVANDDDFDGWESDDVVEEAPKPKPVEKPVRKVTPKPVIKKSTPVHVVAKKEKPKIVIQEQKAGDADGWDDEDWDDM